MCQACTVIREVLHSISKNFLIKMLRSWRKSRKLIPKESLERSTETESEQNFVDSFRKERDSSCSDLLCLRQDYGNQRRKTPPLQLGARVKGEGCWSVPTCVPCPGRSGPGSELVTMHPELFAGLSKKSARDKLNLLWSSIGAGVENCLGLTNN